MLLLVRFYWYKHKNNTILGNNFSEFELKLNLENSNTFFTQFFFLQFIDDVDVHKSALLLIKQNKKLFVKFTHLN